MSTFTSHIQFFPLTELRNRAAMVGENIKGIKIYNGEGTKGALILDIRRTADGTFPDSAFDFFESKYNGIYTAVFSPGKETIFLESSGSDNNYRLPFQFDNPMNGANAQMGKYQQFDAMQLINRILELEKENTELKRDIEELDEEVKKVDTIRGMVEPSLVNIFTQYVVPFFAPKTAPLNSTQPNSNTQQNMSDWRTKHIVVVGDEDETTNNALTVIYEAFGAQDVVRIAQKLQAQPQLINALRGML